MATPKKKAVAKRKRKPPARRNGRPTKLTQPVADRITEGVSLGMTYREAAMAGGIHEDTLDVWRRRGAAESNTIYTRFIRQLARAAESTAIDYLEKIRQSIMESPVKVREHIKQDESGKVILTEIHRETLPPDIKGAQARIKQLEVTLLAWHRSNQASRRLATIPGVGVITATALVATIGDGAQFRSGRQLSAWLGLVPRQQAWPGGCDNGTNISRRRRRRSRT